MKKKKGKTRLRWRGSVEWLVMHSKGVEATPTTVSGGRSSERRWQNKQKTKQANKQEREKALEA